MYLLKIEYLGTIRSNKLEIPEEFLKNSKRAIGSSIFAFKDHLSLCSKKKQICHSCFFKTSRRKD